MEIVVLVEAAITQVEVAVIQILLIYVLHLNLVDKRYLDQ